MALYKMVRKKGISPEKESSRKIHRLIPAGTPQK
jgi:hypothetical protein